MKLINISSTLDKGLGNRINSIYIYRTIKYASSSQDKDNLRFPAPSLR